MAYDRTALLPAQIYVQSSWPSTHVCVGIGLRWTGVEGFVLGCVKLEVSVSGSQPCYNGYRSAMILSDCCSLVTGPLTCPFLLFIESHNECRKGPYFAVGDKMYLCVG